MKMLAAAGLLVVLTAAASTAQTPQPAAGRAEAQAPAPPEGPAISAAQIQRWFEAFTVLQAQDALQLTEAQYGRFVTRLKALQDVRRRHQQARNQILAD